MRRSLRTRILGLFAALAALSIAASGFGIWHGATRGVPEGFLSAFVIAAFLQLGIAAVFWVVFDTTLARPLEKLAATLRVRVHSGQAQGLDLHDARHLGDLAPAADAITRALGDSALGTATAVAAETRRLEAERARLTALLTEIPVATILVNADNRIVLYDGQAAEILAQAHHPRLMADMADYFDPKALAAARRATDRSGLEHDFALPGRDGAARYSAKMKPMEGGGYLLVIDDAETRLPPDAARPIVYDFDLLDARPPKSLAAARLSELTFCVFDTETTGLLPHRDEVVQIGALRVLNGRIVPGERFETLVDPGRTIPETATKVHGITDRMVAGQPDIATAGRRFHAFAHHAVIVAHNAPFDMAFLHRHAGAMGVAWDHPILDTVLLSAVLFGTTEEHTLDALCARLGVDLPERSRHTAMGDAEATAGAFLRMLPMLRAQGIETLGALLEETRKHGRLLEDMN